MAADNISLTLTWAGERGRGGERRPSAFQRLGLARKEGRRDGEGDEGEIGRNTPFIIRQFE